MHGAGLTTARKGIRLAGTRTVLTAAAATAVPIWQISNFASMVGVRTAKLKRIKARNNAAGDTWLHIGTGIPCVESMPALRLVNNFNGDFAEGDLPEIEFSADITAYVDALPVDVQVEVEEIG